MRYLCRALFSSSLLFLASSLCAYAQVSTNTSIVLRAKAEPADFRTNETFTVHRRVEEAQIRFVATDRIGKPVLGLGPQDVQVFDGQIAVSELKSFVLSRYQPLELGIIVDLSASIDGRQQGQALMTAHLLSGIFDGRRDEAFLVGFSNKVHLLQKPTTDIGMIRAALIANPGREGLTSLFDAVVQTCRSEFGAANPEGRQRILLLFSDGADTLSMHGPDDAVREALRSGATIYAITSTRDSAGFKNLQRLTEQTAGKIYLIPKRQQLGALTSAMIESVRGEYTITFRPATSAAGFHSVRIQPVDPGVSLRANSGYFLGPD